MRKVTPKKARKEIGKKSPKPYKFSPSTRKKMSKAHTGKKLSEETKQKIREARAEREWMIQNGYMKPFKHSKATKELLSKLAKKRKHRPSRAAIKKSAQERKARSEDRKLARKIEKGLL